MDVGGRGHVRAAAIDQLRIWGERIDVPVVAGDEGGDPGAVTYDAIQLAKRTVLIRLSLTPPGGCTPSTT